jgi:WXG100 family type VII secretion target
MGLPTPPQPCLPPAGKIRQPAPNNTAFLRMLAAGFRLIVGPTGKSSAPRPRAAERNIRTLTRNGWSGPGQRLHGQPENQTERITMSAPIVRANYDQLAQMTSLFAQHADRTRQTLQHLYRQQETLQGGDWLGQGAQKFYSEMNSHVVPTLNRLVHALEQAAETTRQISQIQQQAETQAASFFKLNGAPVLVGAGSNAAATGVRAETGSGPGGMPQNELNPDMAGAENLSAFVRPPVKTGKTLRQKIAQGSTALGLLAAAISVLEAGGSMAAAGIGTTVGVLLAPIAGFFLGTEIAEGWEKDEALQQDFKQYVTSAAMYEAGKLAWAQAIEKHPNLANGLNESGVKAVKEVTGRWRKAMNTVVENTYAMEEVAPPGPAERAKIWQGNYDAWVDGMSREFFLVYANRNYHKR